MPISASKAPKALPAKAKQLWADTFNGVFENCDGPTKDCDQRAARIAWNQVKGKYRKMGDQWVLKSTEGSEAYIGVELVITKASLGADGSMRWQAVTSDIDEDRATERTSLALFQDWVERVRYGVASSFLPNEPRMPFLGLSHYPAFDDGSGAAGTTIKMFTDGEQFKASGIFHTDESHPLGPALFEAVRQERALVKKGDTIDNPIRISAGWWDLQHSHGDFVFTRKKLTDTCPMCAKGIGDKTYLRGQLDHFAATRVPMNPRTNLEIQEKSMAVTTRKQDAESIIDDPELIESVDRKARLIGKADTDDEIHPAMVYRASKAGDMIRSKRKELEMTVDELASKTPVTSSTISGIESGTIKIPSKPVIMAIAKALKISEADIVGTLPSNSEPGDKVATNKADFGAFLRSQRKKKKMALAALAKATEITEVDLSDFETNKRRPGKRMIDAIGEALELEDDELEEMAGFFSKDGEDKRAPLFKKGNKKGKSHKSEGESDVEDEAYIERDHNMVAVDVAPPRPLGGAISIKDAEGFMDAQERLSDMHSNWDVFRTVVSNILSAPPEEVPNKVRAMSQAINQFGSRIDSLKASLADAYMLQSSVEDDKHEDEYEEEVYDDDEYETEEIETLVETGGATARSEIMPEVTNEVVNDNIPEPIRAVEAIRADASLTVQQKSAGIQEALNTYTTEIDTQLTQNDPARQATAIADAVAQAVKSAMAPIHESLGLMNAKLGEQAQVPQNQMVPVQLPQQKSFAPGQSPQAVAPQAPAGLPISSETGQPSKIRAAVNKSMNIVANGNNY